MKRTLLCSAILIAGIVAVWFSFFRSSQAVPANIRKQVSFVIFYPPASSSTKVDVKSFKYVGNSKVLSYLVSVDGTTLSITEQITPDSFVDIPDFYPKLTASLNNYYSFASSLGNVYLTRPKELNGKQSAIMNAQGTLMFANSTNGDLSSDQWRKFFNSLQVIK